MSKPSQQFFNCKILKDHKIIHELPWIRDGKIVSPENMFFDEKTVVDLKIDCKGAIIAPGFIYVQINDKNYENGGERHHAAALYKACRYLAGQLFSMHVERAGMLPEVAKTQENIGDKKRLEDCYKLMKTLAPNSVIN